jgi:hypothetical protein
MSHIYLDFEGVGPDGFGFTVGQDSPNEIMAERVSNFFAEGKPFRMVVTSIEELS